MKDDSEDLTEEYRETRDFLIAYVGVIVVMVILFVGLFVWNNLPEDVHVCESSDWWKHDECLEGGSYNYGYPIAHGTSHVYVVIPEPPPRIHPMRGGYPI